MRQNLYNLSPLDGRYQKKLSSLKKYFSEASLIKYRLMIEIEYLKFLSQKKAIDKFFPKEELMLDKIIVDLNHIDLLTIKNIEDKVKHDVKAIEYFLQKKFRRIKLEKFIPFIHLGLTSEDVNNLAYALILKDCYLETISKKITQILAILKNLAILYSKTPLLARTHGQPAVATTFGKEIANYYWRLKKQAAKLKLFKFEGKLNGAVGNYNAVSLVFPKIQWLKFSEEFIKSFGLQPNLLTTQLLPYDNWIEYFQTIFLVNNILLNFCQDIWTYIMLEEVKLKKSDQQVGSSTMPQKINPIDFENCEGNLQIANSYFQFYEQKLTVSRLQRDLSDSTVKRTFGTALSHSVLAWDSLSKGLSKIAVNEAKTDQNLNSHWEILAEAVQIYLRSKGNKKGYEKLKKLTQGKQLTKEGYMRIIKKLRLDKVKGADFINLSPQKYIGYAEKLTELIVKNSTLI